jgi:DnaK suppressor protein
MPRREALGRLAQTLLARTAEQHQKLADDLGDLRDVRTADSGGDSGDWAFEAGSDEIASRLAEFEDRRLRQFEQVLARLRQGTFGICESCRKRIPLTRMNALPYTLFCIHCEREMEKRPAVHDRRGTGNWGKIFDAQASMQDQRINLSEIEMNLTGNR